MVSRGDPFRWVGATLDGKLRIDAVVGEGGFGVVYRGHHVGFDAPVAFKCLKVPAELVGEERERFRRAFLEEGRLLHKLSRATSGIVQALDVGVAESPGGVWTPYLVLEWLDGTSLEDDLLARRARGLGGRALGEAIELLEPAARSLGVAHRMGVAHRDVKPANLFITRVAGEPSVKVLDFGIAKVLTENESVTRALAATGGTLQAFTPKYGAPEQFTRRYGATGPWTDVFALALVLVEVTSGRDALEGDDTGQLFVSSVDESRRPSLRERGVAVSDAVEAVVLRALAVDPRERFSDADQLWNALCAAAAEQPSFAEPAIAATVVAPGRLPTAPGVAAPAGAVVTEMAPAPVLGPDATVPSTLGPRTTSPQVASVPGSGLRPNRSPLLAALVVTGGVIGLAGAGTVAWKVFGRTSAEPSLASLVATGSAPAATTAASSAPAQSAAPAPLAPMAEVPPGSFEMGSARPNVGELRAREVTISRAFRIDKREVSVGEYSQCVGARACAAPGCATSSNGDDAMTCVSREQSETYCRWVGKRLPTEAEWELAARQAGTLGIKGTNGGAAEWVADAFELDLGTGAATDPLVSWSPGMKAVLRGGSPNTNASDATFKKRVAMDAGASGIGTGFRCAARAE